MGSYQKLEYTCSKEVQKQIDELVRLKDISLEDVAFLLKNFKIVDVEISMNSGNVKVDALGEEILSTLFCSEFQLNTEERELLLENIRSAITEGYKGNS